jgi:hypothetical protein
VVIQRILFVTIRTRAMVPAIVFPTTSRYLRCVTHLLQQLDVTLLNFVMETANVLQGLLLVVKLLWAVFDSDSPSTYCINKLSWSFE